MLWSIDTCQSKVSAYPNHVTISRAQVCSSSRSRGFWSWPLTKCWFSIGSRSHVCLTCWKQGRIVRKAVNANPGLKVKIEFERFLLCKWLFAALFCVYGDDLNSNSNLTSKLENSNQNSSFSWVSLIGLWKIRPRSYALGWSKPKYHSLVPDEYDTLNTVTVLLKSAL